MNFVGNKKAECPFSPNRSPAQRVRFGKEEQRRERALTYKISRSKRYRACSDVVRVAGFEPTASWTRTMRATNCATPGYGPMEDGETDAPQLICSIIFFSGPSVKWNIGICSGKCSLLLCAKELISSDALIFLRRNGGEAMKYECLKLEERRIIEEMYAKGAKPGEIAERVGKCQATIYRELERGKTGETDSRFRQGYSAAVAEARVNRSYRNRGRRKAAQ